MSPPHAWLLSFPLACCAELGFQGNEVLSAEIGSGIQVLTQGSKGRSILPCDKVRVSGAQHKGQEDLVGKLEMRGPY